MTSIVFGPDPTSFATILNTLDLLEKQLPDLGLESFLVFNQAYRVVTQTIKDHAEADYFKCPADVERFTAAFAAQYVQIIRELAANGTSQSAAWNRLLQSGSRPHCIQLLIGANAHINRDLPLIIADFGQGPHDTNAVQDIRRIDALLLQSGKQIILLFDEPYSALNFVKKHLRWLYFRPVMYVILSWRTAAWKHGLRQQKSIRIADCLLRLGWWLRF